MCKEFITFSNIKFEEHKFHCYKSPIFKEVVDIDNVLVSKKVSSGEKNYKYFIGYLYDDYKIKPLHIMLPKTSLNVKLYHGQTKCMYFLFEDDELFEKIQYYLR